MVPRDRLSRAVAAEVETSEKFAHRPLPGLQPAMAHSRPGGHSAPENHDLSWSDRAEDVAIPSTHMAEQPVRRVLDAREAFPVKHEVLRATYADSARESFLEIGTTLPVRVA